jgi:hypothetical protein
LTILSGAMIGVINGLVCFIFEATAPFEFNITVMGEHKGIFNKIGMIQFLNIGALMLFSDFTMGFDRSSVKIPILVGKHQDFDTLWYYDIGAKITMAMISNSIAPMIGPGVEPLVKKLLRCILDRCFKKHLRKINNLE